MPIHHNHSKPKTVYHAYDSMDLDGKFNIKELKFDSSSMFSSVQNLTEFKNEHLAEGDLHSVKLSHTAGGQPILLFNFGRNYYERFDVTWVKKNERRAADVEKALESIVNDITKEIAISKGEPVVETTEQVVEATNPFEDAFNSLKGFVGKITDNKKPAKEGLKPSNQNIPIKVEESPAFSSMEHSKEGDFGD